jgi:hypothetical protein
MEERKLTVELTRREAIVIAGSMMAVVEKLVEKGHVGNHTLEIKQLAQRIGNEAAAFFDGE